MESIRRKKETKQYFVRLKLTTLDRLNRLIEISDRNKTSIIEEALDKYLTELEGLY